MDKMDWDTFIRICMCRANFCGLPDTSTKLLTTATLTANIDDADDDVVNKYFWQFSHHLADMKKDAVTRFAIEIVDLDHWRWPTKCVVPLVYFS